MERIEFESVQELAEIMDTYIENKLDESEDNYPIISAYAKYDIAKELIETLILFGNRLGGIIELEDYEMSHYDKEFVVYLTENGVTCEKVFIDDEYRNGEADIVFLHEDCNSRLIDHIDDGDVFEFGFESDEDNDEYTIDGEPATKEEFDGYVARFKKNDEKPATTSTSSTTYKVNGKEVDKETYEKALNELDEKYLDNVQDMLLNYFDFVSEINQWRKLLGWF